MKISILAHVNSRKKEGIEVDMFGEIHVYTRARPINGEANKAIALLLAEHYDVSKSSVELINGLKSKVKVFEIYK